jgi:hypothetical protein
VLQVAAHEVVNTGRASATEMIEEPPEVPEVLETIVLDLVQGREREREHIDGGGRPEGIRVPPGAGEAQACGELAQLLRRSPVGEGIEADTSAEVRRSEDLDGKAAVLEMARGAGEDLARGIGDDDRALGLEDVGNDIAACLPGAGRGHKAEVGTGVHKAQACLRREHDSLVLPTQELPALPPGHPAGVTMNLRAKRSANPTKWRGQEARDSQDYGGESVLLYEIYVP